MSGSAGKVVLPRRPFALCPLLLKLGYGFPAAESKASPPVGRWNPGKEHIELRVPTCRCTAKCVDAIAAFFLLSAPLDGPLEEAISSCRRVSIGFSREVPGAAPAGPRPNRRDGTSQDRTFGLGQVAQGIPETLFSYGLYSKASHSFVQSFFSLFANFFFVRRFAFEPGWFHL